VSILCHLAERHGPDHTDHGTAPLDFGYGPASLSRLSQEAESSRIDGPAHALPELQNALEVLIVHLPDTDSGGSGGRERCRTHALPRRVFYISIFSCKS
jgi:hypothetical protein